MGETPRSSEDKPEQNEPEDIRAARILTPEEMEAIKKMPRLPESEQTDAQKKAQAEADKKARKKHAELNKPHAPEINTSEVDPIRATTILERPGKDKTEATSETSPNLGAMAGETGKLPTQEKPAAEKPKVVPEAPKPVRSPEAEKKPASESDKKQAASNEQITALNELTAQKKDIEAKLSADGLSEKEKADLQNQRKNVMEKMIKQGCEVLGRTEDDENKRRKESQEKEWSEGMKASGFKTEENYVARQRQVFIIKELEGKYDELITKNGSLPDGWKKALLDQTKGEISVGGIWGTFLSGVTIGKEDVAMAAKMGIDVHQIKRDGFLSKRIKLDKQTFENVDEFNKFIAQKREEFINEEVQKKISQRKNELLGSDQIKQVIMQREINEIKSAILEKQKAETESREQKKAAEAKAKTEAAEKITPEELEKSLKDLKKKWNEAVLRDTKIKEIEAALKKGDKTGEYKIKGAKGLTPEQAKAKMEAFKKELEDKNQKRSDEMVGIAERLTGEELMKKAYGESGYKPNSDPEKNDKRKQQYFRGLLTDKVWEIKEQNKKAGKKGKALAAAKKVPLTPTEGEKDRGEELEFLKSYKNGDEVIIGESFVDVGSDTIRQFKRGKFVGPMEVNGKIRVECRDEKGQIIVMDSGIFLRLQKNKVILNYARKF